METKIYTYVIGNKTYTMKPLVMGQLQQLINIIKDVQFSGDDIMSLMMGLGDRLPEAIAVILHEPEVSLKDKDIKALSLEIAFEMSPEQTLGIVEDFFECTPVSSLVEKIRETVEKVATKMSQTVSGSPTSA
jgi:hypothetical protein